MLHGSKSRTFFLIPLFFPASCDGGLLKPSQEVWLARELHGHQTEALLCMSAWRGWHSCAVFSSWILTRVSVAVTVVNWTLGMGGSQLCWLCKGLRSGFLPDEDVWFYYYQSSSSFERPGDSTVVTVFPCLFVVPHVRLCCRLNWMYTLPGQNNAVTMWRTHLCIIGCCHGNNEWRI